LIEHASWRWAFFINLPIAAAVVAISLWRIPESRSTITARIDWLGALLATLGLGGLVIGCLESVDLGWSNPLVFGSLMVGFGCLTACVFVEAHVTSPMVPLTLFKSHSFTGANLLTLFLYAAPGIFFFLFPLNLIQVQGYSATAAGAAILPLILLMFLLSRWAGGLVARFGPRGPLTIGPLIVAVGFVLFALPSVGSSYWRSFFPALVVLGFGMAVTVAPLTTVVMNSVDQNRVGAASGINNAVARVAAVLAVAVFGIVMVKAFASHLNHSLGQLSLPPGMLQKLRSDEIRLAGLQVPASLDPNARTAIREMIRDAFVFGFRIVVLICAGLSSASAAIAWLMIPMDRGRARGITNSAHPL
jgi:MFS family permease